MNSVARIELRDFPLSTRIGHYGPGQQVPDQHLLDLTLEVAAEQVLIDTDGMDRVFDYDPLVLEIERLAAAGPYETQERLVTRIAHACADCAAIRSVEIALRKLPIRARGGSLGVRLVVGSEALQQLRAPAAAPRTG